MDQGAVPAPAVSDHHALHLALTAAQLGRGLRRGQLSPDDLFDQFHSVSLALTHFQFHVAGSSRLPANATFLVYAGIGFDRTHSLLVVNPDWTEAIVEIQAKGPGIELNVSRVESITGVTGASTPASIYNTVQMIGSTGPGIHLR